MDRHASMLRIAERYRRPGWSANEERECYRIFFNLCHETPDVNELAIFNSLWHQLSIHLTKELLYYFSVLKVKTKIKALHMNYREFLTFLETPGVHVHAESGLVNVNNTYWAYVGQLWDLRRAAAVHIDAGERAFDPIMFDDTDEENVAADDPNGPDDADAAALDVGNEDGDRAAGVDHMNGAAGNMQEVEDDEVEVVHIEEDQEPEEMDVDTDVDSCVDSN
ncbi:mediator of DNA damage checkpoint protein 1 [Striga asiatica]|uniref:Mediator of DNA damage checkpoint protein 1 n=1 Tax=Striga asiatica TaxID=4170 RepID=A0A5A7R2P1_STRAF|nr:mediator of DNA damage checkpoint protein 1 [Striga asiatica]